MNTKTKLYEGFQFPKTSQEEVLLTLINKGHVSIFDFFWLSGFRTRISEFKTIHGLNLERKTFTSHNKFGNSYQYAIHFLPKNQKEKAIELYKKLNSN